MYRIGVDVGGTFTDFTVLDEESGAPHYLKVPSTPHDPSEAIGNGLAELVRSLSLDPASISHLGHGTTVATNMVIERKGALTGLITTRGFRDVLEIGRQMRPHLYDYSVVRPTPLVPRELRLEVDERILSDGTVIVPLDEAQVEQAARVFAQAGVGAVVVCFIHSYRRPAHERRAGEILRRLLPSAYVSLSSDVLPEFREFERMSTTVLNAYIGPRMGAYMDRLLERARAIGMTCEIDTVHSNGGLMSADDGARSPSPHLRVRPRRGRHRRGGDWPRRRFSEPRDVRCRGHLAPTSRCRRSWHAAVRVGPPRCGLSGEDTDDRHPCDRRRRRQYRRDR